MIQNGVAGALWSKVSNPLLKGIEASADFQPFVQNPDLFLETLLETHRERTGEPARRVAIVTYKGRFKNEVAWMIKGLNRLGVPTEEIDASLLRRHNNKVNEKNNPNNRGYMSNRELGFHSDAFEIVGLMFWFQDIQHLSATQTGMALLPLSISVILGNKVSGWFAHRYQTSHMMIVGAMIRLVGFSGLLVTQFNNDYIYLFVPLVLIGFGGGLGSPMSTSLFMQSTPKQYTGVASGVSRATGQIGSAFAVAVFGQMVNSEKLFILNMKYAVITIIIATLSILIINFLFVKNDIDEYHSSITLKADK
ncbi:MFS transporter [Photorhabdus sp. RM71S]|uniref:MFS transporter n=1 Tax=Photorhabdus sp. RM71S TaxID=3342824 RepID=UPI0036D9B42F